MNLPRFAKVKEELSGMGFVYSLVVGMVLLIFLGKYVASDRAALGLGFPQAAEQPQGPWNAYGTDE